MPYALRLVFLITSTIWAGSLQAQSWVQVEAQPSQAQALVRAEAYANRLPDVNAFRTGATWHVIALGPYSEDEARQTLLQLRAARQIPSDAFLSDGRRFGEQIFGTGRSTASATPQPVEPVEPAAPLVQAEETPAEARRSERLLTREDRQLLQTALKFDGFYNSTIDASFGPGTRRAMSNWQAANGFEQTGILTTLQRQDLVNGYLDVLRSLTMAPVTDTKAGIQVEIPSELVAFDRYDAPFVHYEPKTDDGVKVLLISQSGDNATMAALYDIMQTLKIVPLDGSRALRRNSFFIEGQNDKIISHTSVRLDDGTVKGFTLIWPANDAKRFRLALDAMEKSFSTTAAVLPDTEGAGNQNIDLLSGLEIRRPDRVRSGFFIDRAGAVLTTREAVRQCSRITLNDESDAQIAAEDSVLGLALLRPVDQLAPISVARLASGEPRIQSDIAIAGYSFGGILTAPSVSFGTLEDLKGLDGDTRVKRLSVNSEPADAGGPVFATSGAVVGMVLDQADGARQLPGDVAFAAKSPTLQDFLSANGVSALGDPDVDELAPEDLALLAADLTVLVSCWN